MARAGYYDFVGGALDGRSAKIQQDQIIPPGFVLLKLHGPEAPGLWYELEPVEYIRQRNCTIRKVHHGVARFCGMALPGHDQVAHDGA